MNNSLPKSVERYFWGDDLSELNWIDHKKYIIETILEKGSRSSAAWVIDQAGKDEIIQLLPTLKLSQKSANYWKQYLAS